MRQVDRATGQITATNPNGFCRITPDDGGRPVSAYRSRLRGLPFSAQLVGLRVRFGLVAHRQGYTAINVEALDPAQIPQVDDQAADSAAADPPPADQQEPDELLESLQRLGQGNQIVDPSPEWLAEWKGRRAPELPDGGGPYDGDPSPEEIRAACREIQATWGTQETRRREGHSDGRPPRWYPPGAFCSVNRTVARRELADD